MDQRNTDTRQPDTLRRIIISLLIFVSIVSPVMARSSSEIGQDIINKQQEILENERRLAESAANKKYYETESANLAEGVPKLEAQIKELEEELNGIKLEISILEQQQKLKELEREQTQFSQNETIKGSYMDWKSTSHDVRMFIDEDIDFVKIQQYQSAIAGNQKESIINLTNELVKIDGEMSVLSQKKKELDTKQAEVTEQKRQLEERLAQLRWGISYEAGNIGMLGAAISNGTAQIGALRADQIAAAQQEAEQMANNPGYVNSAGCDGGIPALNTFYFCGNGRDLPQGHGVGLSQWGAFSMASEPHNFSKEQILQFYYTNVQISSGYEGHTINVHGYGVMNIEDYVAGQGEVPAKACGTQQQVADRPDKYALGPSTGWNCWPEEAIKAQAIAHRTYGLQYVWRQGSICATAACQVYVGGNTSRWAAEETRGIVVTQNGYPIEALYSSDNNQGNGTADNESVNQGIDGSGGYIPYLRSVNDNIYDKDWGFPTAPDWTFWRWKTGAYTYHDIDNFMTWAGPRYCGWASGAYACPFADLRNATNDGNPTTADIRLMSIERDTSGRMKRILIVGVNGQQAYVGGWWFKIAWNDWMATIGVNDYIYSQTLNIVQNI